MMSTTTNGDAEVKIDPQKWPTCLQAALVDDTTRRVNLQFAADMLTSRDAKLAEVQAANTELQRLNDDKFRTIQAYCKAASEDKAQLRAAMAVVEAVKKLIDDCDELALPELFSSLTSFEALRSALPQGEATAERQAPASPEGEQATPIESMVNAAADVQAKHIEMFAAAYIKATNIDPQRAELVQQCTADGFKWWFRERTPASTQPATAEPNDLVQQLLGRAAFCDSRGEVKTPKLLREAAAALASESPRERQSFECYATFRKREDENDGREFFFHALWHNETSVSAGERVVKGRFIPDDEQPANVSSKSELEDRALALELRERQYREAIEFFFTPGPGIATPEYATWQNGTRNDTSPHTKTWNAKLDALKAALSPTSAAKQTGGGE